MKRRWEFQASGLFRRLLEFRLASRAVPYIAPLVILRAVQLPSLPGWIRIALSSLRLLLLHLSYLTFANSPEEIQALINAQVK